MTCPEKVAIRKVFTTTTLWSAFTGPVVQLGPIMMLTTSLEKEKVLSF